MPDGTIPDPRMNPKEEKLGVVYFNKEFVAYDKEEFEDSRYLPAGWKINERDSSDEPTNDVLFTWNEIQIKRRMTAFVSEPDHKQGEVTLRIKKFIEANPKAIFKNVDPIKEHKPKNNELVREVKEILDEDNQGASNGTYRWVKDPKVKLSAAITLVEAVLALLVGFNIIHWDKAQLGLVMAVVVAIGGVIQAIWIADRGKKLKIG
jgi:hypothetical protein